MSPTTSTLGRSLNRAMTEMETKATSSRLAVAEAFRRARGGDVETFRDVLASVAAYVRAGEALASEDFVQRVLNRIPRALRSWDPRDDVRAFVDALVAYERRAGAAEIAAKGHEP